MLTDGAYREGRGKATCGIHIRVISTLGQGHWVSTPILNLSFAIDECTAIAAEKKAFRLAVVALQKMSTLEKFERWVRERNYRTMTDPQYDILASKTQYYVAPLTFKENTLITIPYEDLAKQIRDEEKVRETRTTAIRPKGRRKKPKHIRLPPTPDTDVGSCIAVSDTDDEYEADAAPEPVDGLL